MQDFNRGLWFCVKCSWSGVTGVRLALLIAQWQSVSTKQRAGASSLSNSAGVWSALRIAQGVSATPLLQCGLSGLPCRPAQVSFPRCQVLQIARGTRLVKSPVSASPCSSRRACLMSCGSVCRSPLSAFECAKAGSGPTRKLARRTVADGFEFPDPCLVLILCLHDAQQVKGYSRSQFGLLAQVRECVRLVHGGC